MSAENTYLTSFSVKQSSSFWNKSDAFPVEWNILVQKEERISFELPKSCCSIETRTRVYTRNFYNECHQRQIISRQVYLYVIFLIRPLLPWVFILLICKMFSFKRTPASCRNELIPPKEWMKIEKKGGTVLMFSIDPITAVSHHSSILIVLFLS